jgi:hypothetical protein
LGAGLSHWIKSYSGASPPELLRFGMTVPR